MADKHNLQAVADNTVREDKPFVNARIHKLAAGKRAESQSNFGQRYWSMRQARLMGRGSLRPLCQEAAVRWMVLQLLRAQMECRRMILANP